MPTVILPMEESVVESLRDAVTSVSRRVYTPPVKQTETRFPRIVISQFVEREKGFFLRKGSYVRFHIRIEHKSEAGNKPGEMIYKEVHAALHDEPLEIEGHMLLEGTLQRTGADYVDDDGVSYIVATYEGETKVAT